MATAQIFSTMNNKNASIEIEKTFIVESFDDIIYIYPNPTSDNIYEEYFFFNSNENIILLKLSFYPETNPIKNFA